MKIRDAKPLSAKIVFEWKIQLALLFFHLFSNIQEIFQPPTRFQDIANLHVKYVIQIVLLQEFCPIW